MEDEAVSAAMYIEGLDMSGITEEFISKPTGHQTGIANAVKRSRSSEDEKERQVPLNRSSSKRNIKFLLSCCMQALLSVQFMMNHCKGTLEQLQETIEAVEQKNEKLKNFVSELMKDTTETENMHFLSKSSNLPPRKWTTAKKFDRATCDELSKLVVNLMSSSSSCTRQLDTLSSCIEGVKQTSRGVYTFMERFLQKDGKEDTEPADATQPQKGVSVGIDEVALQVKNCWETICSMDGEVKKIANRSAKTDARVNDTLKFVKSLGQERQVQSTGQLRVAGVEVAGVEEEPKYKPQNVLNKDDGSSIGHGNIRPTLRSPFIKQSGNNVIIDVRGIYKTIEISEESSCRLTEENLKQIEITVEAYEKMKNNHGATWFTRKLLPRFFNPSQTLAQCNFNTLGDKLKVLLHVVESEFPNSTVGSVNMKRMRDGINAACRDFKRKHNQSIQDIPHECAVQNVNLNTSAVFDTNK